MYVCQEMYNGQMDASVSRHDLSLFPTVTDLKNHIHQAVKDIENGALALTAPTVLNFSTYLWYSYYSNMGIRENLSYHIILVIDYFLCPLIDLIYRIN
jgi:hypothetical protein